MWPGFVIGCGAPAPLHRGSSACGLSFLAHSVIKPALAERANPARADRKLTFDSSPVSCLSQASFKKDI